MSDKTSNGAGSTPAVPAPPASAPHWSEEETPISAGAVEKMPRWEVTVERQLLIYAPDEATAELKAMDFMGFRKPLQRMGVEAPPIPCKVVECKRLKQPIEEPMPEIVEGPSGRPPQK